LFFSTACCLFTYLQSHLAQLSQADLQQLQPYLQLPQVLTGFDQLL
jgi:hypothetical protein